MKVQTVRKEEVKSMKKQRRGGKRDRAREIEPKASSFSIGPVRPTRSLSLSSGLASSWVQEREKESRSKQEGQREREERERALSAQLAQLVF